MELLKKPQCKHEYIYIDCTVKPRSYVGSMYEFRFICKKCRKTIYITSDELWDTFNMYKSKLNEKIKLESFKDTSDTVVIIFCPGSIALPFVTKTLTGYVADKTIDYFIKKYGINIKEIEEPNQIITSFRK